MGVPVLEVVSSDYANPFVGVNQRSLPAPGLGVGRRAWGKIPRVAAEPETPDRELR